MKIWYQSSSTYGYEPLFEEYGKTLEEQCKRAARKDTEVRVSGVPVFMMDEDKYRIIRYYHISQLFNNMIKAEKEGYDAFIVGNTLDVGWEEGRGLVGIPVVGISHISYSLAALLGKLFAIVTTQEYLCEQYRQQVEQYGFRDRCLPGNYYFQIPEEELARAMKNPQPIVDRFKVVAEKAVADGASVIVPAPGLLPPLVNKTGLTNIRGATVIDSNSAAVKFAELLVDLKKLGMDISRKYGVYCVPDKDLRAQISKTFGKVFNIQF